MIYLIMVKLVWEARRILGRQMACQDGRQVVYWLHA